MIKLIQKQSKNFLNQFQSSDQTVHKHKCYFHGSYNISKFCINKKCTLPLCEKCQPIHLRQHQKQYKQLGQSQILPFQQALQGAIKQFKQIIQTKKYKYTQIEQCMKSVKKKIILCIDKSFNQIQSQIQNSLKLRKLIEEKFEKVRKGSLKALIFYYSDQEQLNQQKNKQMHNQVLLKSLSTAKKLAGTIQKMINQETINLNTMQFLPIFNKQEFDLNKQPKIKKQNLLNHKSHSNNFLSQLNSKRNSLCQIKAETQIKSQLKRFERQSSHDFAQILKNQKQRLENVKIKNNILGKNSDLQNKSKCFELNYGSKSLENFCSLRQKNQQIVQDRPLQMRLNNSSNASSHFVYSSNKQKSIKTLQGNSKEQLQKIKRKYIGDESLSKQKLKLSKNSIKYDVLNKQNIINCQEERDNNQLKNRILSRQQIRLNIQNRISSKSKVVKYEANKNTVSKSQIGKITQNNLNQKQKYSNYVIESPKSRSNQQQFTLNKNFHLETNRSATEKEKLMMSSIKKQYKIQQTQQVLKEQKHLISFNEDRFNLPAKKYLQDKNTNVYNKLNDFILQKYTKPAKNIQNERNKQNQISDFDKNKDIKQIDQELQNKKQSIYSQMKDKIRLPSPHLSYDHINRQITQSKSKQQFIKLGRIDERSGILGSKRFNYLEQKVKNQQIN